MLSSRTVAIYLPPGVISVMNPSSPFTTRICPLGATVRPSGSFKLPPLETVRPVPAECLRRSGLKMAPMRLLRLSAM